MSTRINIVKVLNGHGDKTMKTSAPVKLFNNNKQITVIVVIVKTCFGFQPTLGAIMLGTRNYI